MLKDFSGTEFLDIQESGYPDDLTFHRAILLWE